MFCSSSKLVEERSTGTGEVLAVEGGVFWALLSVVTADIIDAEGVNNPMLVRQKKVTGLFVGLTTRIGKVKSGETYQL